MLVLAKARKSSLEKSVSLTERGQITTVPTQRRFFCCYAAAAMVATVPNQISKVPRTPKEIDEPQNPKKAAMINRRHFCN